MDKNNLIGLPDQKNEYVALVAKARDNQKHEIEGQQLVAKLRSELFKAYIKQGFTRKEALELLKAEIVNIELKGYDLE